MSTDKDKPQGFPFDDAAQALWNKTLAELDGEIVQANEAIRESFEGLDDAAKRKLYKVSCQQHAETIYQDLKQDDPTGNDKEQRALSRALAIETIRPNFSIDSIGFNLDDLDTNGNGLEKYGPTAKTLSFESFGVRDNVVSLILKNDRIWLKDRAYMGENFLSRLDDFLTMKAKAVPLAVHESVTRGRAAFKESALYATLKEIKDSTPQTGAQNNTGLDSVGLDEL